MSEDDIKDGAFSPEVLEFEEFYQSSTARDSTESNNVSKVYHTISVYNKVLKLDFDAKIKLSNKSSYSNYDPKGIFSFTPSFPNTQSSFGSVSYNYKNKITFMMSEIEMSTLFFYVDKLALYTLPNGIIDSKILTLFPSEKNIYTVKSFFHKYKYNTAILTLGIIKNGDANNIIFSLNKQINQDKINLYYTWNSNGNINRIPEFFSFMNSCKLAFNSLYPIIAEKTVNNLFI